MGDRYSGKIKKFCDAFKEGLPYPTNNREQRKGSGIVTNEY
jgi:hypothetical protein